MITTSTLTKKEKLQIARKSMREFQNKTVYDSSRGISRPPAITRFHEVFHFNCLRNLLK